MKVDIRQAERETYDLCVIGAGPAGMIVVLEYQKLQPAHRILLLEYGPDHQSAPKNFLDDSIKVVTTQNHHLPYECTNKGLGGSSATWGGRCVMYDEIDFRSRQMVNGECTWDLPLFHDVRRFADTAAEYFECGPAQFNLADIPGLNDSRIADGFQNGDVTDLTLERWSMPTRFGKRFRAKVAESPNIHLLAGWEAFSLGAPATNGPARLGIRDFFRQQQAKVTSRKLVIAAGAQETTRLLLKNPQIFQERGGLPPALGRYYQGHVSGKIASVHFHGDPRKTNHGFLRTPDGVYMRRRFQLSTQALLDNNLLNTAFWLDNPLYVDPSHHNGAMSFMYLAMISPILGKRLAPPAIAHSITKGKVFGVPQHLRNILKDFPKSLTIPAATFFGRYCLRRKLPGVFLYSPRNVYALHFHAEQLPSPENRMELAADGETLNIHYHYTDQDVDSVIRAHHFLDNWLRKCKCGELSFWYQESELPDAIRANSIDGLHQVGTTRISKAAEKGVVDENLKIWGTPNSYVCSSSVFPTSGQANPTFLMGAFAARLAHHLSSTASKLEP